MAAVNHRTRRKVWLIGRRGAPFLDRARQIADDCELQFEPGIAAEISHVYRVSGMPLPPVSEAPFRAPHASVGSDAMLGQLRGHVWRPGELARAHGGVLYLDDATEFGLGALGAIESAWRRGSVRLSSSVPKELAREGDEHERNQLCVPTWFSLVVGTLPCPCGNRGAETAPCLCDDRDIERFHDRVRSLVEGAEVERL